MCIALTPDNDSECRARIRNGCDKFVEIPREMGDIEAAAMIRDIGLHVLVDLNGYTSGGRLSLLALRVAPVQVRV